MKKNKRKNIGFECTICADPYSQCPFVANETKKIEHKKTKNVLDSLSDSQKDKIGIVFIYLVYALAFLVCYIAVRYNI